MSSTHTSKFTATQPAPQAVTHTRAFARGFFSGRWYEPLALTYDDAGRVTRASGEVPRGTHIDPRTFVHSLPNGHSHCFQFAIVGLTERSIVGASGERDDFWAWREAMYRAALTLGPEELGAIARALYTLMRANGYRSVTEFHYLHHDRDGSPYTQRTLLADVLIEAALEVGLSIVMAPVYYRQGGFDRPALPEQRRFIFKDTDEYLELISRLDARWGAHPHVKIARGIHSLRAASPHEIRALCESLEPQRPLHIHIAEQTREVEECIAQWGARPVQWLHDNVELDARYHLVHATHVDASEIELIARSGASINLCPTTEANLGDGIFPLSDLLRARGRFWIGSDSHVTLSPLEELRMLDYSQRLAHRSRGVVNTARSGQRGELLWAEALDVDEYGDQRGVFMSGVLIRSNDLITSSKPRDALLSALVYGGTSDQLDAVILNGTEHTREIADEIKSDFARVISGLKNAL